MTRSSRPAPFLRPVAARRRGRGLLRPGRILSVLAGLACLASSPAGAQPASPPTTSSPAPQSVNCPEFLANGVRCVRGPGLKGGYYWMAVPADWNGVLVVHAHGGPRLGAPEIDDSVEDLERFSMLVDQGYAWAGHTYRRGGYGVRMAAEDTEDLRRIAWAHLGRPRLTVLHGQSWGGNVAAKAGELYARDAEGRVVWDGVVTTNGLLAGGTRGYDFRADLRAVYQYVCRNHPAPDEPTYPVWRGLPEDSDLTRAELTRRVEQCTGVDRPDARRSPEQRQNLADILGVIGIEEDQLVSHLAWATFTFRDMVGRRLDGLNPFDNSDTVYQGSHDDTALNAGVERFAADPQAVARLAYDADLSGLIVAPMITLHAKYDPTVFVEHEAMYRETVERAGRGHLLVQTFTDEDQHSRLSGAEYLAVFDALVAWIDTGERPTPAAIASRCEAQPQPHRAEGCHFDTDFHPATD